MTFAEMAILTASIRRKSDEVDRLQSTLDAIDALPDYYDGRWLSRSHDDASFMAGYRLAMRRVKALLHPEAGES